jgi:hypothetical protein
MFDSVPSDMSEEIRSKAFNYVNCLKDNKPLPGVNLVVLQDQYTKLLTMRFRRKASVTVAKRLAKNIMQQHFNQLMLELH